jgi:beta-galactosidase
VPYAAPLVNLEVSGAGDLLAVGTANPISEELYVGSQRKAWQGRLMAVVRASGQPGQITLKASVEGLPAAQIELRAG